MAKVISNNCAIPSYNKPKSSLSKPDIAYTKPLYYISLITALSCPININKYCAKSGLIHKIYTCLILVLIVAANGYSFQGRMNTSYSFLAQTVVITDIMQQAVLLVSNVYSIVNILLCGEKYIQSYFDMMKAFDNKLLTTMNLSRKQFKFNIQLFLSHIVMILLGIYDSWVWNNAVGFYVWRFYAFRLFTFYLTLIIVMQMHTFANALQTRFHILNERLFDVSVNWIGNVQSHEALTLRDLLLAYNKNSVNTESNGISLRCVLKMHDLLCDLINVINDAFGLNMVLLVCSIIVNSVIALNLTLIVGTGVQPAAENTYLHLIALNIFWALFFMTMGVAVARSCDAASKEAWQSAVICYKLLSVIPIRSTIAKEQEARILLKQFANQIQLRKPEFDACGFFPVNHSMLYAIIGAISSYIVIIIQFNNSPIRANIWKNSTQT